MTTASLDTSTDDAVGGGLPRRVLTIVLGPLWVRTFRDPVRDGHLRLSGLSRSERQLARAGLVLLALLLVSVLFADAWRTGTLHQLTGHNELRFVPVVALPVAVFGFLVAWSLICWGALAAAPSVRLVVAVVFLATNSSLAVTGIAGGLGSWILEHGGDVMQVGYLATPALLVASALLHPLLRRRERVSRVVTGVLRGLVLVSLTLLFGTMLWVHVAAEDSGFPVLMPAVLDAALGQFNAYLLPLVYVAAVTVIDFALDVSTSLSEPARALARRWARALVVAVLALKLLVQVVAERDAWLATLELQPVAVTRTVVSLLLLAVVVVAVTRFPHSDDYALAKERTMYGASVVLASSHLLSVLGVGIGLFLLGQLGSEAGVNINDHIPYDWLSSWGLLLAGSAATVAGVVLMRRSAGGYGDELGSALVVVGSWNAVAFANPAFDLQLGVSYPVIDVLVTIGVLVLLAVRWRSLSAGQLVTLTTVLLFSWLVNSRGDYVSFLGGLVGLPAILVVVFGVVLTLASGASFASTSSQRLPSRARPLLFVGYLLISVVILFWVEVTHEGSQDVHSLAGFFFIGIPMAAWLLGRRIVPRQPAVATASNPA